MAADELNLPVRLVEVLTASLATAGVEIPLSIGLAVVALLSLVTLGYGARELRRNGLASFGALIVTVGSGLLTAGIVFSFARALWSPLPGEITGRISIASHGKRVPLREVRVALLDFHGKSIELGPAIVDGRSGQFALNYAPVIADHPRSLRVTAPGCEAHHEPLSRSALAAGTSLDVVYRCVRA